MSVCSSCFRLFRFSNTHCKTLEILLLVIFQTPKQSVKFSFLFSRSKHFVNLVFSFYSAFLLLQEDKSHIQLLRPPHSCPCWRLSRFVVSGWERRVVKPLDRLFGFFRLPRGLSRRTRNCRSTAGAQHGMCELARHGTAGVRQGHGMVRVN